MSQIQSSDIFRTICNHIDLAHEVIASKSCKGLENASILPLLSKSKEILLNAFPSHKYDQVPIDIGQNPYLAYSHLRKALGIVINNDPCADSSDREYLKDSNPAIERALAELELASLKLEQSLERDETIKEYLHYQATLYPYRKDSAQINEPKNEDRKIQLAAQYILHANPSFIKILQALLKEQPGNWVKAKELPPYHSRIVKNLTRKAVNDSLLITQNKGGEPHLQITPFGREAVSYIRDNGLVKVLYALIIGDANQFSPHEETSLPNSKQSLAVD